MRHGNARRIGFTRPNPKPPERLVALGPSGAVYSTDGIVWSIADSYAALAEADTISRVIYGSQGYMAVGFNASFTPIVFMSKTGKNWEKITAPPSGGRCWGAAYSPELDLYVVIAQDRIFSWTKAGGFVLRATLSGVSLQGIAWGGGYFVAVASAGTNRMYVSTDGITWTPVTSTNIAGQALYSVVQRTDGSWVVGGLNAWKFSATEDPTGTWSNVNIASTGAFAGIVAHESNYVSAQYGNTAIRWTNAKSTPSARTAPYAPPAQCNGYHSPALGKTFFPRANNSACLYSANNGSTWQNQVRAGITFNDLNAIGGSG